MFDPDPFSDPFQRKLAKQQNLVIVLTPNLTPNYDSPQFYVMTCHTILAKVYCKGDIKGLDEKVKKNSALQ